MAKDVAEIDKDLATNLRRAKTSPMYFAFVAKGASDGALLVEKKKIPPADIADAKKRVGGSKVFRGRVGPDDDGNLVFETPGEPPATLAKAIKTVAQRDGGLMIRPICKQNAELEDEDGEDESGEGSEDGVVTDVVGDQTETNGAPNGKTTTEVSDKKSGEKPGKEKDEAPKKVEPKDNPALKVAARLKELKPEYSQAIGVVSSTVAGRLKTLMAGASTMIEKKEYSKALQVLDKLEEEMRAGVSQKTAQVSTQPETVEIDDDFGLAMEDMFDEDAAPYKAKLDQVQSTYELAAKIEPEYITTMSGIEELAENREFTKAITALDKLLVQCNKTLTNTAKEFAVADREFGIYLRLGQRLSESDGPLKADGADVLDLYKQAQDAAAELDYSEALSLIEQAKARALPLQKKLDEEADRVRELTARSKVADEEAFDFASKTKDESWGFDSDDDARNFFIGNAMGEKGELVKSDKLKQMEKQTELAIQRKDALLAAGATPEQAGEIAFANIPRNFWPDSVVREVLMYKRARQAFEEEKLAKLNVAEEEDLIDEILDSEEAVLEKVSSIVDKLPNGDTIEEAKEKAKKLGEMGLKTLSDRAGDILDSEKLAQAGEILGDFADNFGYVSEGVGILISGARAIKGGLDARKIEDDPVAKKLLEFKRNKAIVETINKILDLGLGLDDLCPALKIASGGKEMVVESIKAVQYFIKLAEIANLKSDAKMDPETMMHLPLARMARNQKVRASKATVAAITALIQTSGAAVELSGVGAPAGLALDVTGKVVELGGKAVFRAINWADARRCVKTMRLAAGPPPNRKAMTMIFQNSNRYAVYALAYGAVFGNDPWAIDYVCKQGLTEDDLKSPATSVQIVREFMLVTAGGIMGEGDEEEDDPTIRPDLDQPTLKDKGMNLAKKAMAKARDKVIGRDTSKPYNAAWRAASVAISRANWQQTKVGAIAAGWYDGRTGLGAALTQYTNAKTAFDKEETVDTAEDLYAALWLLRDAVAVVQTLTNDQKTLHEGMTDYKEKLDALVRAEYEKISVRREQLIDIAEHGDLPPDEMEKAKQEKLKKASEEAIALATQKKTEREALIREYWESHKHKTPYGNLSMGQFAAKAATELDLDPEDMMPLAGAVVEFSNECVAQLNSLLSGTPDDVLPKQLEMQVKQLEGSVVEALRTLANLYYESTQQRRGPRDEETEVGEDDGTWKASNFAVSSAAWKATKKEAIKNGLVDSSTGIGKALETYEKAQKVYQSNRDDEKSVRLVNIALIKVKEAFEKFRPLNRRKLVHQGMAAYREKLLTKIRQADLAFQRERSIKQQIKAEEPKPVAWTPTNFEFTKAAWVEMRDKAIENGMVDNKTGLPAAFSSLDTALSTLRSAKTGTDTKKLTKAKTSFQSSATTLETKLTKFEPKLKNGLPHTGMQSYKVRMLNDLTKLVQTELV